MYQHRPAVNHHHLHAGDPLYIGLTHQDVDLILQGVDLILCLVGRIPLVVERILLLIVVVKHHHAGEEHHLLEDVLHHLLYEGKGHQQGLLYLPLCLLEHVVSIALVNID